MTMNSASVTTTITLDNEQAYNVPTDNLKRSTLSCIHDRYIFI